MQQSEKRTQKKHYNLLHRLFLNSKLTGAHALRRTLDNKALLIHKLHKKTDFRKNKDKANLQYKPQELQLQTKP